MVEQIKSDLLGTSTVLRRKAAKKAREVDGLLCPALAEALRMELSSKHWETKVELIETIGLLQCKAAMDTLLQYVFGKGSDFDLVLSKAAKALVRISRTSAADCAMIWRIVELNCYSATEGALEAIGYDKMLLADDQIQRLLDHCWDFGADRPKGYTDPRYGLAAACAGWKSALCRPFLLHCLTSDDVPLRYVAEKALAGKYVKLR